MGSPQQLTELRRRLYQCTEFRAEALNEDARRAWHVDVFAGENDPVEEVVEKLLWSTSGVGTLGLYGGTGVGKTTQVYRLVHELWVRHHIVAIRIGYDDFSSLSSPPDVSDFLLSIVGGLADSAHKLGLLSTSWDNDPINDRVLRLLKRLKFDVSVSAGPFDVKAALKEDDSFRRRIRDHLSGQVARLVKEVRDFASSVLVDIRNNKADCRGVALIVDSTDRLSAPASADEAMQSAVRNLFIQNGDNLEFEDLHAIYLLPPWLPISDGGALRIPTVAFPAIRIADRANEDAPSGLALLDAIVRKRMPDIENLISGADLKELYRNSGGVQRVLFVLLKEVAGRSRRASRLPIEREIVQTSIDSITQDYLAISGEIAPALSHIDRTKSVDGLEQATLSQLGKYFQALVILQVANGEKWFTIHPLMRKRLAAVQAVR